ncbi:MAG TPA: chemotaxis protein CheC [Atopostipes sp.]|nr:chemotaxis protein CheC [Atopostipes sp.]
MRLAKDELMSSALKEILNLGGANAATSLSRLIKKPVRMDVPTLELMEYIQVYQRILADDQEVKVVILKLIGDEGAFLYVISPDNAIELAEMMYPDSTEITPYLIDSAMEELGNILVNSFLNAIMRVVNVNLITSVPFLQQDYFGSILSSVYLEEGVYDSTIVIMHNEFWSENEKIDGKLFFIPTPELMDDVIENLNF